MDFKIENDLISEIHLTQVQAKVYLLVTCYGKMSPQTISEKLKISKDDAENTAKDLMNFGAFIDISETEYEAMHPRFTVVNMYRRMCERENIEFKRNKIVDSIGVVLEKPYDDARTK
ncbi:Sugar-specific transcriptional regulator TrmB protein [Marine Group I thaumarchaeote SCGC AAA799-P11]|uniref:Sugar-specific transcriptional regulator TrmB protein n=1 Tax=Marine Group I thaumarchaeote SCGC AAA799-P11 TaxID=1502295 RepID=A0A087S1N1_9ARCH|nr:Sugar-specific transcriptional regulator TrmB protein [Marine Group I thaumarchaeote SCGC AAA799-P11]